MEQKTKELTEENEKRQKELDEKEREAIKNREYDSHFHFHNRRSYIDYDKNHHTYHDLSAYEKIRQELVNKMAPIKTMIRIHDLMNSVLQYTGDGSGYILPDDKVRLMVQVCKQSGSDKKDNFINTFLNELKIKTGIDLENE